MTREQTDRQINLQKIHNARTKRAFKNIKASENLYLQYGGAYTEQELQIIEDLHPGLKAAWENKPVDTVMNEIDIAEVLEQLNMFAHYVQEDNHFMV